MVRSGVVVFCSSAMMLLVSIFMRQVSALKPVVAGGAAGRPLVQAYAVVMLAAEQSFNCQALC